MMSASTPLLSAAETWALQSFLSGVGDSNSFDIAPEWSMYYDRHELNPNVIVDDRETRKSKAREALSQRERLTKATKDLMALDGRFMDDEPDIKLPPIERAPTPSPSPPPQRRISALRSLLSDETVLPRVPQQADKQSSKTLPPPLSGESSYPPPQGWPMSPNRASPSSSNTSTRTSVPPQQRHRQDDAHSIPTPSASTSTSTSSSLPPTTPTDYNPQSQKRLRSAAPQAQVLANQPVLQSQPKQTALLSASQKKANHIQSEQKRRANIRRGYEALCETVPALREAIKAEEEASRAASGSVAADNGKKRRRKNPSANDAQDKADGRVGPRSENMVLQKTIDYITDLLAEQTALKIRLQRAKDIGLQKGLSTVLFPTAGTINGVPLWERVWNGGTGIDDNDADGEGGESEEEDNDS